METDSLARFALRRAQQKKPSNLNTSKKKSIDSMEPQDSAVDEFPIGSDISDDEHIRQSPEILPPEANQVETRYSSSLHSLVNGESESTVKRKILIVGGGVAGLVLALSLKRVSARQNLNLIPIVYEKSANFDTGSENHLLWRWAVQSLVFFGLIQVDLGLGKALGKISQPIMQFKSKDLDTMEPLVEWPPQGPDVMFSSNADDDPLPPMLAIRRMDLIRLLLKTLAGVNSEDVSASAKFQPSCANNSDIAGDDVTGVEGDLCKQNWFENEKWRRMLSEVNVGYEFLSYSISPSTGVVTAKFNTSNSEWSETADMLIGADGIKSLVRSQMLEGKNSIKFGNSAVICGTTRIFVTPHDSPDCFENGNEIPDLTRRDIEKFCPDGMALSIVGGGVGFGCIPVGNGMVGWNLTISQTEPGQHTEKIIMAKTRDALSEALRRDPRSSILSSKTPPRHSSIPNFQDDENRRFSDSLVQRPSSHAGSAMGSRSSLFIQPQPGSRSSIYLDPFATADEVKLEGSELRRLALKLSMNTELPHPCHALIARCDVDSLEITDVREISEDAVQSYSLKSHPGRVMIIGDAAHGVAANAHGSVGASLAITDAILLAKLLANHMSHTSTRNDSMAFSAVAEAFDQARVPIGSACVKEARAEAGYGKVENTWMRGLYRMNKRFTASSWAVSTYSTMITRGGVSDYPEPSLAPLE